MPISLPPVHLAPLSLSINRALSVNRGLISSQKALLIWLLLGSLALATLTCHWCPKHARCPQASIPLLLLLPLVAPISCHVCLVFSFRDCCELSALCSAIGHPQVTVTTLFVCACTFLITSKPLGGRAEN